MSAMLTMKAAKALLTQLESMLEEVQTPECRHWLEQEIEGYSHTSRLPWYRIVPCRQRGHFVNLKTRRYLTCHINSQALSQRDLAQIQFIYAREPAAHYLLQHNSGVGLWPTQLLEDYQEQLIPGHRCLQAWHEPVVSLREQLMEGIEHYICEYPKLAVLQNHSNLKVLRHQRWHI